MCVFGYFIGKGSFVVVDMFIYSYGYIIGVFDYEGYDGVFYVNGIV